MKVVGDETLRVIARAGGRHGALGTVKSLGRDRWPDWRIWLVRYLWFLAPLETSFGRQNAG